MVLKICENCGKKYDYNGKKGNIFSKCCSRNCIKELKEKETKPQFRTCKYCGKKYWWENKGHWNKNNEQITITGKNNGNSIVNSTIYCCFECGKKDRYAKTKNTTIKHYGAIGWASKELLEKCQTTSKKKYGTINNYNKIKQTNLEKYGVENPSQREDLKETISTNIKLAYQEHSEEIRNKTIQTNLKKYGVEYAQQTEEVKEKAKQTCLIRYGVDNANKCEEIKERAKQTTLKRYGVAHASQNKNIASKIKETYFNKSKEEKQEIADKRIETCLNKYGTKYAIEAEEVKEKIKQTNLERYGKTTSFNYEKIKQTNLKKYGIEYTCLLSSAQHNNKYLISNLNIKFKNRLLNNGIFAELEFSLKKYSFDIKIDNTLIEINPSFTHNSSTEVYKGDKRIPPKDPLYHQQKSILAKENGYRCIHVWDWDDEEKIIKMLISKKILYARNLKIKEVSMKDCVLFLSAYHLQNSCIGQEIRLGLYKEKELIEVMTFGKSRYNKKYEWELLRLCTNSDYKVVGGAERLFKYFVKTYKPASIISYCDNSKFSGEVYLRLGMELKSYGKPSKHWYNIKTGRHITDNLLRQRGYSQLHNDSVHKKGESNEWLMLENDYVEIYDCGQSTYIWNN